MVPVFVLVGRPNVGKSTLFNRFTGSQNALVADYPGLTRDRQYGEATAHNRPFIIVDTGGIGVDDLDVDTLMSKQSTTALDEASAVFFIVDARSGLTPLDQEIAVQLRKLSKPIYLVINKIDGLDVDIASADFRSLGFEAVYKVSATHGRGVSDFLKQVLDRSVNTDTSDAVLTATERLHPDAIRIAFVGRPNVGKSTLINRLLGEERVVVFDLPGTTRDSIAIPFQHDHQNYTLIDTAGVRRRSRIDEKIEKFSVIKTLQAIQSAQVCLLVLDAREGLTDQDLHVLSFILEAGKALVIVMNKWDGLEDSHKEHVRETLSRKLTFIQFAKIRFISALHGSGVGLLFKDIKQAYQSAQQTFSTPQLTRLLQDIVTQHAPPMHQGRAVKLRYAHMGGQNPPCIVIHGNRVDALPESYKRYLINAFIEQLKLVGTPLKVEFKSGNNPFKDKKNLLTPRQLRQRQRLMKHVKRKK